MHDKLLQLCSQDFLQGSSTTKTVLGWLTVKG